MRKIVLLKITLLIWGITFIHIFASLAYFYWIFWWFDLFMHFLGGIWLGLFSIWLVFLSGYIKSPAVIQKNIFLIALMMPGLLGGVWEVFEYFLGVTYTHEQYIFDMASDLLMDFGGGLLAGAYLIHFFKIHKP